ncbi:MAG: ABC transporter permease, partial [Planctomycetales bacterium]|nr:ABC transporter permease [Planctomycetales bacterium]
QFERIRRVFPQPGVDRPQAVAEDSTQTIYDYFQLSSRDLIIDEDTAQAVDASFARQATRLITYLANTVVKVESPPVRRGRMDVSAEDSVFAERANPDRPEVTGPLLSRPVPYSTILGVDSDSALALSQHTSLEYQEVRSPFCWINTWLAEQLSAGPGDWLRITYFAPETINGSEVEQDLRVVVAGVVPLTEPLQGFRRNRPASYGQAPTVFNDPDLTPHVPGLTDKDSMANWDAPFKLDHELILPADDAYYANHRLTPKIFMPYRYASSTLFFGSRFGRTTAIRFPLAKFPDEQSVRTKIEDALMATRPQKGLTFLPVRAHALQAASGTTPFDMLFLSLSFFVIVAALLLVTLLFKLGIGQRAGQLGILAAQGYPAARIRRLLLCELSVVAVGGAGLGILLGLLYARLMIAGLESWWVGAISTPFLHFSFTGRSLLIGAVAGVLTSLLTIYAVLRRLSRLAPLTLLRGHSDVPGGPSGRAHRLGLSCAGFAVLAAIGLIVAAIGQTGMARAGSFFGSGMLLLLAALLAIGQWISRGRPLAAQASHHGNLGTLAWRAISR